MGVTVCAMTCPRIEGRRYAFRLPDRLRAAREQAGLSQADLAHHTGISLKSVQRYEAGTTTPRPPQLLSWAMVTGFSLAWLGQGEDTREDTLKSAATVDTVNGGTGKNGVRRSAGATPGPGRPQPFTAAEDHDDVSAPEPSGGS